MTDNLLHLRPNIPITYSFRLAGEADIDILTTLRIDFLTEVNGQPYSSEQQLHNEIRLYFQKHIRDNDFVAWLCFSEETIIATSGICFYMVPPSYNNVNGRIGYIMNMYTKQEFRNHGIASVLFNKMIEEGKKRGVGKLALHATEAGEKIYSKFGFTKSGNEMILSF